MGRRPAVRKHVLKLQIVGMESHEQLADAYGAHFVSVLGELSVNN